LAPLLALPIDIALLVGSWLVPGLGFLAKGSYWRAFAIFTLINGTFLTGMFLHGTVLVPEFHYTSPAFNIVSLLTFLGQLGNGGASLLVIARDQFAEWLAQAGRFDPANAPLWYLLPGNEQHALFDLATLYLLVSGSANYFCVSNFYDRHISPRRASAAEHGDSK